MAESSDPLSARTHRAEAKHLFNRTWELLDRRRRTRVQDDEMLHSAYASRFHWARVGRPVNFSIGEWQISRVCAVLGRPEAALYHARRSLEIARRANLSSFYVAYAYEALARGAAVAGKRKEQDRAILAARRIGRRIRDQDDQRMLWEDLDTIE